MQLEELTQQVVRLGQQVVEAADHIRALEAKNVEIEAELARARELQKLHLTEMASGKKDSGKSELRSVKKLYPEQFTPNNDNFKEWS